MPAYQVVFNKTKQLTCQYLSTDQINWLPITLIGETLNVDDRTYAREGKGK